jgi:hypothetical protein
MVRQIHQTLWNWLRRFCSQKPAALLFDLMRSMTGDSFHRQSHVLAVISNARARYRRASVVRFRAGKQDILEAAARLPP